MSASPQYLEITPELSSTLLTHGTEAFQLTTDGIFEGRIENKWEPVLNDQYTLCMFIDRVLPPSIDFMFAARLESYHHERMKKGLKDALSGKCVTGEYVEVDAVQVSLIQSAKDDMSGTECRIRGSIHLKVSQH